MSPDPVWPGLFLPCSLPRLLPAAAGRGLEPSPARRFRGASPHRLLSYAKEPPVAASFAHGALKIQISEPPWLAICTPSLPAFPPWRRMRVSTWESGALGD